MSLPPARARRRRRRAPTSGAGDPLDVVREDLDRLMESMRHAGVAEKLLESMSRKCLRTPRRQTGRVDFRTNRQPRWRIVAEHPDYASELNANLVLLRLLIDSLHMQNAPDVDERLIADISERHFAALGLSDHTLDPLTDEVLNWDELVEDVVTNPVHGYSRFHIGHQDPKLQPKHMPANVRWQLKPSNDFQDGMDIRVARIAYKIHLLTQTADAQLVGQVLDAFRGLCDSLGMAEVLRTAEE